MNIEYPEITAYPDGFPVPTISVAGQIDYGIRRSTQDGYPDQTRFYGTNPTVMTAQFQVPVALLPDWIPWMDKWATTRWVLMPIPTQYPGWGSDAPITREIVRVGNLEQTLQGATLALVSANIEILPQDIGDGLRGVGLPVTPPVESGNWIIAGKPKTASPDWIIAGDPAAPSSPDWIDSQSPADHKGS